MVCGLLDKKMGTILSFTSRVFPLKISRFGLSIVLAGVLILAFSGCSKSNTPAQAPASESPALSQEQIAEEVARQVAEQVAAAQAAEQAAAAQTPPAPQAEPAAPAAAPAPAPVAPAPSPAQAGSSTPATPAPAATPAAPKYAIGDTGPGGGIVFSASGGKYKEITKPENAGNLHAPPPAGWRLPTMPELMQVYTALHATVNFGAGWYFSSSVVSGTKGRGGANYSRDHAMLSPGQTDYDRARTLFPNTSFILAAGGGPDSINLIRFTDGRIILAVQEDILYYSDFSQPSGDRDYTFVELDDITKCLYVREF
jgi:hypothetical protein